MELSKRMGHQERLIRHKLTELASYLGGPSLSHQDAINLTSHANQLANMASQLMGLFVVKFDKEADDDS